MVFVLIAKFDRKISRLYNFWNFVTRFLFLVWQVVLISPFLILVCYCFVVNYSNLLKCKGSTPRPIERCQDSAFYKTGLNLWAGQIFLAAHVVLPNGQHLCHDSWVMIFSICFSNFTFQFMIHINFVEGAKTPKKFCFNIFGNYLLDKCNNLIFYLNENILLIITKKY